MGAVARITNTFLNTNILDSFIYCLSILARHITFEILLELLGLGQSETGIEPQEFVEAPGPVILRLGNAIYAGVLNSLASLGYFSLIGRAG